MTRVATLTSHMSHLLYNEMSLT